MLTRDFKESVAQRLANDPAFADALFAEGVQCLLSGDVETGKAVLRDDINATVGFERLAAETGGSAKSLMRMFGRSGNPQARNLFAVLAHVQKATNRELVVRAAS